YFLIYQQIENNVISPMIQAKNNQLSALVIFVAITVGLHVLGILGAFLSIPIAACLKILFDEYYLEKRKSKSDNDETSMADLLKKIN
ncbi:MAG: AI-2E family transporter, partial [Candidatus Nanogingivalis sp.]